MNYPHLMQSWESGMMLSILVNVLARPECSVNSHPVAPARVVSELSLCKDS